MHWSPVGPRVRFRSCRGLMRRVIALTKSALAYQGKGRRRRLAAVRLSGVVEGRADAVARRYRRKGDTLCNQWRAVVTIMTERPTAIDGTPAEASEAFEDMLRIVEELDTPDGYKAELIRGKIVVSPWSKLRYKKAMKSLRLQLEPHAPEGHDGCGAVPLCLRRLRAGVRP